MIDLDLELPAIVDVHAELAPELRARGIPFHLTVLYPFAPPDEVDALLPPLEQVLARHTPFALELAGVGEWPGVVYADPEPSELLRALLHDVWGALPAFPPYQGEHDDPHPHATIAVPDAASQARGSRSRPRGASGIAARAGDGRGASAAGGARAGPLEAPPQARARESIVTLVACIGGGQLGRMLGLAGIPLGLRFRFLDPSADAPAAEVGDLVVGAYDDPAALARLADGADVVTYEFENVPVDAARSVGAVPPSRALELGQDRLTEKELFTRLGIPTARYGATADTGLPALVKSRRLGYDGKGQRLAREHEPSASTSWPRSSSSSSASSRSWPFADATARRGSGRSPRTCTGTGSCASRAPRRRMLPRETAEELVTRLLDELGYVGVIALELFEVGGRLLANEFAPRVHNTGHWTIDGAETSQFENHLRAILGLPLGSTAARAPAAMVNLIGGVPDVGALLALPGAHVHLYGKEAASRPQARPRHARRRDRRRRRRGDPAGGRRRCGPVGPARTSAGRRRGRRSCVRTRGTGGAAASARAGASCAR